MALPCPRDCSGHGICKYGKCFCEPGFGGVACAVILDCPHKCGRNGVCFRGQCICAHGFTGPNCNIPLAKSTLKADVRQNIYPDDADYQLFRFTNPAIEDMDELKEVLTMPTAVKTVTDAINQTGSNAVLPGTSFIDVLSTIAGANGGDVNEDVRADVVTAMSLSADEHAFACSQGCGAHGRCLTGRCYCEPGYTGDLCQLTVDMKAVEQLENARKIAQLHDGDVVDGDSNDTEQRNVQISMTANGWVISPVLALMLSFCAGVVAIKVYNAITRNKNTLIDSKSH